MLQVVETYSCIYAVPIENFVFNELAFNDATIDVFFVQNVEHCLEELAIRKLSGKVLNLRQAFHLKDLVYKRLDLGIFHGCYRCLFSRFIRNV